MNQPPPPPHHPPPGHAPHPAPPGGPFGGEPEKQNSRRAITSLVLAIGAFLLGIIPFVGFAGVIAIVLGVLDRKDPNPMLKHGMATAGIVIGSLAVVGACAWTAFFMLVASAAASGSCPHVYAFDGEGYRLDGDMASGALFAGAERSDLDRLESLREVDGRYHLRVQNDLEEVDHINRLAVVVVDHDAGDEVLPAQDGSLVVVREPTPPLSATDASGASVLSSLATLDGEVIGTAATQGDATAERWTLTFARPSSSQAVLILRGNNTRFAEDAFVNYMAQMGQGAGPLFAWVIDDDCACTRTYIDEEVARLGLPLVVEILDDAGQWSPLITVGPIGPATLRSQALPVSLPAEARTTDVTLRVTATKRFWALDQIQLAAAADEGVEPTTVITPLAATFQGNDVTRALDAEDDARIVLQPTEHVDVTFAAPPRVHDKSRTALVSLHGYYDLPIGGRPGINPAVMLAHRLGLTSLPSFAAAYAKRSNPR